MKTRWPYLLVAVLVAGTVLAQDVKKVSIRGSNTFGEKLGPALIAGYTVKNPDVAFELESKGSGTGIAALLLGECDIASSSRVLNEDEQRIAKSRSIKVENFVVGYYGIAVVVNANHPVKALTDKQVQRIFTGHITNWKDVGGPDRAINLIIPDQNAGTYLGFQELAMANKPYAADAIQKPAYHDIAEAIAADPYAIGYVSLNVMKEMNLQGILINGVHPSSMAIIEGLYPYARMVRLLIVRGNTPREARSFIRYVQSHEGQNIVEKTGFVPRFTTKMDMGGLGP